MLYGKNLVICDQEKQYAENLLQMLRLKAKEHLQIYLFYTLEELRAFAAEKEIQILVIADEYPYQERKEISAITKCVLLREEKELSEEEAGVLRYQSANAIWTQIMAAEEAASKLQALDSWERPENVKKNEIIGVYSPVHRIGRTRFAIELGKKLAEKSPTLYLNLEAFSGEEFYFTSHPEESLGDLLYYSQQRQGNIGIQISAMAGQIGKLDYVYPMTFLQDLKDVRREEWLGLLEQIQRQSIYRKVILDLSDCVDGLFEILQKCDVVYTPFLDEPASRAKLNQYVENLRRSGLEDVLEKTVQKRWIPRKNESGEKGAVSNRKH